MSTITTLIIDNGEPYDDHRTYFVRVDSAEDGLALRDMIEAVGRCSVYALGEMQWFGEGDPVGIEADESWLTDCFGWHQEGVDRVRAMVRLSPTSVAQRVLAALEASL